MHVSAGAHACARHMSRDEKRSGPETRMIFSVFFHAVCWLWGSHVQRIYIPSCAGARW